MMLTLKAYLEVMMLHQIGRKWSWCQQKSSGIEEWCWHQGRILLRWCSIFPKLPSHHHEKASKRYSIGMQGAENHHHDDPTSYGIRECRHVELKNPPSCLWRGNSEISTAGMVSALKRHRAYWNGPISGVNRRHDDPNFEDTVPIKLIVKVGTIINFRFNHAYDRPLASG